MTGRDACGIVLAMLRTEDVDVVIAELVQWLRNEVAPVLLSGANCKAIINVSAGREIRTVIEKHQVIIAVPPKHQ